MISKKQLIFKKESFPEIIDSIKDLIVIDKSIMFKIDSENIFIYSAMGGARGEILKLFRSYTLKTSDYITNYDTIEREINYIIGKGDKLHKAISIMNIDTNDVTLDLNLRYNEDKDLDEARAGIFKCGGLKVTYVGMERNTIAITDRVKLNRMLSDDLIKWKFDVTQQEFKTIKKIASLETGEDNKTFTAKAKDGVVYILEDNEWELEVCEIDDTNNYEVSFVKKFFNNIKDTSSVINFKIFDSFIAVESEQSLLLMSYETNFEEY